MEKLVKCILQKVKQGEISKQCALEMLSEVKQGKLTDDLFSSANTTGKDTDIAVVGIAVRFPGADSVDVFWQNLVQGKKSITSYPQQRWPVADFYSPHQNTKNKSYTKWGGFIDTIDEFAASFFSLPVDEAALMDPQQRLFLEIASQTFQNAGYKKSCLTGSKTGVFVGARMSTYETFGRQEQVNYRSYLTGNIANFIATRVSDFYNLKGPSLVLDTACSSSLAAVHYACQSIVKRESELALAGGVHLHVTPYSFLRLCEARALSTGPESYVFDRRANGFVLGEGVGAILLKPLSAAIDDNDIVYAVIKGSAINNDGNTLGSTTPNHRGQKSVILDAYDNAGVDPASVTYIETHGTGTAIGDPIEMKALNEVFKECTGKKGYCGVGSVKTNIGHLDTAAGIAGIIKVILALYHKVIPPTLGCQMPNPRLQFLSSPFYPVTKPHPWRNGSDLRRAGVSSFGLGGTNCHVILQETPIVNTQNTTAKQRNHHLFTLSALTPASLMALIEKYRIFLDTHSRHSFHDICYSVNTGRDRYPCRLAIVAGNSEELRLRLNNVSLRNDSRLYTDDHAMTFYGTNESNRKSPLVFLCSELQYQFPQMIEYLSQNESVFRNSMAQCREIIQRLCEKKYAGTLPLSLHKDSDAVRFSVNYALAHLWLSWNVKPSVVIGYGSGEYLAACLCGMISLEDALCLLIHRSNIDKEHMYEEILNTVSIKSATIPYVNNQTGTVITKGATAKDYWKKGEMQSEAFDAGMLGLLSRGYRNFLEIGLGNELYDRVGVLCNNSGINDANRVYSLKQENDDSVDLSRSLGVLFAAGFPVNLDAYENSFPGNKIHLPLYPFEREKCWIEQQKNVPVLSPHVYTETVSHDNNPLLADHIVQGDSILPGVCFLTKVLSIATAQLHKPFNTVCDMVLQNMLKIAPGKKAELHFNFSTTKNDGFSITSSADTKYKKPITHVCGKLGIHTTENTTENKKHIKERLTSRSYSGNEIYHFLDTCGVSYGKTLQCIDRLWAGTDWAVSRLITPEKLHTPACTTQELCTASLLDATLQTVAGIGIDTHSAQKLVYVPFYLKDFIIFKPFPHQCYGYIELKKGIWGDDLLCCTIFVLDQEENICARCNEFYFKQISRNKLSHPDQALPDVGKKEPWLYVPHWIEKSSRHCEKHACHHQIVFCDASTAHRHIVHHLQQNSSKLTTVYAGQETKKGNTGEYYIRIDEPSDYQWLIDELDRQAADIGQIVHLWTYERKSHMALNSQRLIDYQLHGVLSLFNLVKALGRKRMNHTVQIRIVSSYSRQVTGSDSDIAVERSPLSGFAKVIPLEYPYIRCCCIDMPYAETQDSKELQLLLHELQQMITDTEVAFYDNRRYVPTLKRILPSLNSIPASTALKHNGVYVITGGLGGIGHALACYLKEKYNARLILIHRSAHEDAANTVKETGGTIIHGVADVADRQQMLEVKSKIEAAGWNIDGIFHLAGILNDELIQRKSTEDFLEVLRVKMVGTWVLYDLFSSDEPDFMVLFSSIVSIFGNAGQSDYASANAFLDAFAHFYPPAVSLNWTVWSEAGMALRSGVIDKNLSRGIKAFSLQDGIAAMITAMNQQSNQVVVLNNALENLGTGEESMKECDNRSENMHTDQRFITEETDIMENSDQLHHFIETILVEKIAAILEVDGTDISSHTNFLELGLDSVNLLDIAAWLGETIVSDVYPTLLFEYPSVESLAVYLSQEYNDVCKNLQKNAKTHEMQHGSFIPVSQPRQSDSDKSAPVQDREAWQQFTTDEHHSPRSYVPLRAKTGRHESITPESSGIRQTDIAVIGFAGRFPKALSVNEYWTNFEKSIDGISDIPSERAALYQNARTPSGLKIRGGFLEHIDQFDPLFFNLSPLETDYIDPQQRLFLETAWQTLEMAGYNRRRLDRVNAGVYVGASQVEYRHVGSGKTTVSPYMGLGNSLSVIANRVSYLLNLHGPSLTIDTACSSSLVAIHLACQSLKNHESDIAIAGGVQIYLCPETFTIFHLSGMLSKDGMCKTFDKSADGYVRGEGVGAVLLKPLKKAVEDGDTVHAVVKGSSVNHDGGHKIGISAPNPRAQKQVIIDVLKNSAVDPETIGYIEAHGTATSLGDPVEVEALTQVFREYTDKRSFCAISTAKSCIGHLEASAGIAGFIRAVLALKHKKIPPTLHFHQANPLIPFCNSPFYVNDATRPWYAPKKIRRAGVSSFGFGGTNCHIVVEEFKASEKIHTAHNDFPDILVLTAKTKNALSDILGQTVDFLDKNSDCSIHDICFSANTGRNYFDYRLCIQAHSLEQLRDRLELIRFKGIENAQNPFGITYGHQEAQPCVCAFYFEDSVNHDTHLQALLDNLVPVFPQIRTYKHVIQKQCSDNHSIQNELLSFTLALVISRIWISLGLKPAVCMGGDQGARIAYVLKENATPEQEIETLSRLEYGVDKDYVRLVKNDSEPTENQIGTFEHALKRKKVNCLININGAQFISDLISLSSSTVQKNLRVISCMNSSMSLWTSLLRGVGDMVTGGVDLNLDVLYEHRAVQRIPLPTYPFQRKRFWLDIPSSPEKKLESLPVHKGKASVSVKIDTAFFDLLKAIMADVLKIDKTDIDAKAHFTSLGIDSLIIQNAIHAIEKHIDTALEPTVFMDYPSIESLADFLSSRYTITKKNFYENKEKTSSIHIIDQSKTRPDAIAVVGLACRFPGAADYKEFWKNLVHGIDSTREVREARGDIDKAFTCHGLNPDTCCTRGGFIEGIDQFAASFFNISDEEAVLMDPQQRLLLEMAWHTFETAGYSKKSVWNKHIGVFIGARAGTYRAQGDRTYAREAVTGSIGNFLAARLSNFFNLKGPSLVFDTACSSSLVALHYACKSIIRGECGQALVGGVELKINADTFVSLNHANALSADGCIHAFDKKANGFVPGEGVGVLLIKPLEKALEDRDTVFAVVRGSAVNNDGNTMGLTTPEYESQKQVIEHALHDARVNPETITCIEAHGTGTMIGDPIEIKALTQIYEKFTSRKNYCAIGSVKTNIGHLDTAAGIAGVIKTVLSLYNSQIPASLHCTEPNPRFSFIQSPFYINTKLSRWNPVQKIKRAGISSFGFGGTNCHVILEEPPDTAITPVKEHPAKLHIFTLSAQSEAALKALQREYREWLKENTAHAIQDICFTANTGRQSFSCRKAILCKDTADLHEKISHDTVPVASCDKTPRCAFLFPGQGALYHGVAQDLYTSEPVFTRAIEQCTELSSPFLDKPLVDYLYNGKCGIVAETETKIAQPLTFALSYALAQTWLHWGIQPSLVIGHGIGEFAAAAVAGVCSLADAIKLVCMRAALIQEHGEQGSMAVLCTDRNSVGKYIASLPENDQRNVSIAAVNGPAAITVSGSISAVKQMIAIAERDNVKTYSLGVSHDLHSPLIKPMLDRYEKILDQIEFSQNKIDLVSTVTGNLVDETIMGKKYWMDHLLQPVLFAASIDEALLHETTVFLEVGPGDTLGSMVDQQVKHTSVSTIPTLVNGKRDWLSVMESVAKLYLLGMDVDFDRFYQDCGRRITLPLYPFERKKYWYSQKVQSDTAKGSLPNDHCLPDYFDRCSEFTLSRIVCNKTLSYDNDIIVRNHQVNAVPTAPAALLWDWAFSAGVFACNNTSVCLQEIIHHTPIQVRKDQKIDTRIIIKHETDTRFSIQSFKNGSWIENCCGKLAETQSSKNENIDILSLKKSLGDNHMHGTEIYTHMRSIGLVFGPFLRSIKNVWYDRNHSFVELQIPDPSNASPFSHHPAVIDGALQSTIAAMSLRSNGKTNETYIPFFIKEIRYEDVLPQQCYGYITVKDSEKSEIIECDIQVTDYRGKVLAKVNGCILKKIRSHLLHPDQAETNAHETAAWREKEEHAVYVTDERRNTECSSVHTNAYDTVLYKPAWKKKSLGESKLNISNKSCALFMNRDHSHELLASYFERNVPIVRIYAGNEYLAGKNFYVIDPSDQHHYNKLFKELYTQHTLTDIIHLWTATAEEQGEYSLQQIDDYHKNGVFSLFVMVKALASCRNQKHLALHAITSYTQAITEDDSRIAFEKSPFLGLMKVLPLEFPWLRCYTYDMDPAHNEKWHEDAYREIFSKNDEPFVAFRKNCRWVPVLTPLRSKKVVPGGTVSLKHKGTYLVTGGLGGLGMELAGYLVKKYQARLILVSRSFDIPRNTWASYTAQGDNDRNHNRIQAVQKWESFGSEIIIFKADVACEHDMELAAKQLNRDGIHVDGIFHLAGIISDKMIFHKTLDEFKQVLRPKITGTYLIQRLFGQETVDFVVLFSSIASVLGNPGQSDYASGNAFMDHYAAYMRSKATAVQSINWPMWSGTGMGVHSESLERMRKTGFQPLDPSQGFDIIEKSLQTIEEPRVIVLTDPKMRELLRDHMEQPEQKKNAMQMPMPAKITSRSKLKQIQTFVCSTIARFLDITENDINQNETFLNIGLDSVSLIELARKIEEDFAIQLYPTIFFEYQTIASLSQYLYDEFGEKISRNVFTNSEAANTGLVIQKATPDIRSGVAAADNSTSVEMATRAAPIMENDIAVIGMAGRFPQADSVHEFWGLLQKGKDVIEKVPAHRWNVDSFYDPEPVTDGKTYLKNGGFIADLDKFDAAFFNVSPKEAKEMDPQQRLFLEACYHALECGGYGGKKLTHSNTGVFVGVSYNQYNDLLSHISPFTGLGNSRAIIANRISYFLNVHGPSMTIDTLCSSSMVAIHTACKSLLNDECEFALAGGVFAVLNPVYYIGISQFRGFSQSGKCRTFDRRADGYVPGEGAGVVLLRPLKKAVENGDNILAVIKATAVNHDGRSNNLTAPNAAAQENVIQKALKNGNIDPSTITYLEAHGTGTALGDPIEMAGLTKAYEKYSNAKGWCALGSVKSNIGHLEPAAGVAGLIKVVLSLKHKKIPPTVHFNEMNHFINLVDTPFYINDKLSDWTVAKRRRAGISSFGMGGTNAHAILEEYTGTTNHHAESSRTGNILIISARTLSGLKTLVSQYRQFFNKNRYCNLDDVCYTSSTGRGHFNHRLAVWGHSVDHFQRTLDRIASDGLNDSVSVSSHNGYFYSEISPHTPDITFIFNELDFQQPNNDTWLVKLLDSQDNSRAVLEKCKEVLHSRKMEFTYEDFRRNPKAASFIIEYALTEMLKTWNIPGKILDYGCGSALVQSMPECIHLDEALHRITHKPEFQSVQCTVESDHKKGSIAIVFGKWNDEFDTLSAHTAPIHLDRIEQTAFHEILCRIYTAGIDVNWEAFYSSEKRYKVELPLYPFDRKRFWVEELPGHNTVHTAIAATSEASESENETIQEQLSEPDETAVIPKNKLREKAAQIFADELIHRLEFDSEDVDYNANLVDYGFDSVFAVQIMKVYEDIVNSSLDPTLLFDYRTINEFAEFLITEYEDQFRRLCADSDPSENSPSCGHSRFANPPTRDKPQKDTARFCLEEKSSPLKGRKVKV